MKNLSSILVFALTLGIFGLTNTSCEKMTDTKTTPEIVKPELSTGGPYVRMFVYNPFNNTADCVAISESCHIVDIVLTAEAGEYLDEFDDLVGGNGSDIADYFNGSNYSRLFPFLDDEEFDSILQDLRSGNCSMSKYVSGGVTYYVVYHTSSPNVPLYVFPIEN